MKKGFTLIELLIVVAIIAILAAIAVPNFLEAQTRAKVSRVQGELRTLATAIEAYQVDHNKPAPQSKPGVATGPFHSIYWDGINGVESGSGTLTSAITTPIAYLTTYMFFDPFSQAGTNIDERLYSYHPYQWIWPQPITSTTPLTDSDPVNGAGYVTGQGFKELYGAWRLLSIGPDKTYYNRVIGSGYSSPNIRVPYDPTNGTIHFANIIRSQKEGAQSKYIVSPGGGTNP